MTPKEQRIANRIKYLQKHRPSAPQLAELKKNFPQLVQGATNQGTTTSAPSQNTTNPTQQTGTTSGNFGIESPNVANPSPLTSANTTTTETPSAQGSSTTTTASGSNKVDGVNFGGKVTGELKDLQRSQIGLADTATNLADKSLESSGLGQAFAPKLPQRTTGANLEADRSRIENDVFSRLTKNLDQDYGLARSQAEQSLKNRGIPFSADPNSRYQQELGRMDQNYLAAKTDARQRATEIGGTEYQRAFDINNNLINSEFNLQSGTRNQQIGEAAGLSQIGVGGAVDIEKQKEEERKRREAAALAALEAKNRTEVANITTGNNSPFNA